MTLPSPTAEQVAKAVVLAARHFGEDPTAVMATDTFSRARLTALVALKEAFACEGYIQIARLLNFPVPRKASSLAHNACTTLWWSDELVDEIVGELVAEQYGEQAA